eukprot:403369198
MKGFFQKHLVLTILIVSLSNCQFLQKRGIEQYFTGFMQGMQEDTKITTTCIDASLKLDNFFIYIENTLAAIYQNKDISIMTDINGLNQALTTLTGITSNCGVSDIVTATITRIKTFGPLEYFKRIFLQFSIIFKYLMILNEGLMLGEKRDVGEALGVFYKTMFGITRGNSNS